MKIEVLKTLKGAKLVRRGTVFDSTVAPIPNNILKELSNGADTVKQIGAVIATEKPIVAVESEIEIKQPVVEQYNASDIGSFDPDPIPDIGEAMDRTMDLAKVQPQEKLSVIDELEMLINHYPSMSKVAKILGTSAQSVGRWRKGLNKPSDEFVAKIHKAFKGLS